MCIRSPSAAAYLAPRSPNTDSAWKSFAHRLLKRSAMRCLIVFKSNFKSEMGNTGTDLIHVRVDVASEGPPTDWQMHFMQKKLQKISQNGKQQFDWLVNDHAIY